MNLQNVSIIHRSIAIFHFTSFHSASDEVPSHGSVRVSDPPEVSGLQHLPITLRAFPTTTGLRKRRSTKRPQQPPTDLLSIFSESEVRLTPFFLSLLSSFPLCRQIQLLNDRRARPPVRPRPSSGRRGRRRSRCSLPVKVSRDCPSERERGCTHARFPPAAPLPRSFPRAAHGLGQFIWSSGREGG